MSVEIREAWRGYVARASRVLGVWSAIAFVAVGLDVLLVRLSFGYWPRVYRDSIESSLLSVSDPFAAIAILSCDVLLPFSVVTLAARRALRMEPAFERWTSVALLGSALVCAFSWWDPYGYVEWLFD